MATAKQFGPVGYRDPAGAISPDGKWIAYSEGRFLRVRPIDGGPFVDLPAGEGQIRNITWRPDSGAVLTDGFRGQAGWALYDLAAHTRQGLWADRASLTASVEGSSTPSTIKVSDLRQPAWSADTNSIAAIVNGKEGQELWTISADGSTALARRIAGRISSPAWNSRGEIACIVASNGPPRLTLPCGRTEITIDPDLPAYGPIAFSPNGDTIYTALANAGGTVDLWAVPAAGGSATQLTFFSRDTYAPSVASNGALVFKLQDYRTTVSVAPAEGGPSAALATFQSETPSWDPTGQWIGITYGTWRRIPDDANYPDIAQDAGIIGSDSSHPAAAPARVVHASKSEDQALCWSPNRRWIAFHSHKDDSDDIWLRPADSEATPRRISFLGRGAEVGWPRWSPDGRWLLFYGANKATHHTVMYLIGADQDSGQMTDAHEIPVSGVAADVSHAEWLPDSAHLVVLGEASPGRQVIYTVAREGGPAHLVHQIETEHHTAGLGVSPDGRDVAFTAPAPDGFYQIFRLPIAGGTPVQVTKDPSNKTQPAWSPDGKRIAFTVWSYEGQFWKVEGRR